MSLPTVELGSLRVSRLIAGGGPFAGISHQSPALNRAMLDYHTTARVLETLHTCVAAGINTLLARADAHIMRLLHEFRGEGGQIHWIAQTAPEYRTVEDNVRRAVAAGADAVYLHGGVCETLWSEGELAELERLLAVLRATGRPCGFAAHDPRCHLDLAPRLAVDFQMVCLFNCGSLHSGGGEHFDPADPAAALAAIAAIQRPCLAYKILGAGRYDPAVQFPRVFGEIKPSDAVVVGLYTEHHPRQVEDNAALVRQCLADQPVARS
ncbi:MAG: hypothetical protein IT204_25490 [Fimbriimonadaceae bacterium]|nr:hypothetical protein [Fimbriimonadaceae bacterium]